MLQNSLPTDFKSKFYPVLNGLPQSQPTFYCDMDGVLANWDDAFNAAGINVEEFKGNPQGLWDHFLKSFDGGEGFYRNLAPYPGAFEFYHEVQNLVESNGYRFEILSATIKLVHVKTVRAEKEAWVADVLQDPFTRVNLGPLAEHKWLWCRDSRDILLDDRMINISQWKKAGGIGILHTDFESSLTQIHQLFKPQVLN